MKNIWIRSTILTLVLILTGLLLVACASKPSIVGYWQDTQIKNRYVEFTSDGKVIIDDVEGIFTGTYELISGNYVKFDSPMLGLLYDIGVYTLKFQISGNTLKLLGGNKSITFKRVR